MDLSVSVSLTTKGIEEVLNRANKLSVRQRSILILLGKPQTLKYIFQKQEMFSHEEIMEVIDNLENAGFVALSGGKMPRAASPTSGAHVQLVNGIVISEAKFLLVDFCVDSFGTQSQTFVDEIGGCKNEKSLQTCLKNIYAVTEEHAPDRLPVLNKIVAEINATA